MPRSGSCISLARVRHALYLCRQRFTETKATRSSCTSSCLDMSGRQPSLCADSVAESGLSSYRQLAHSGLQPHCSSWSLERPQWDPGPKTNGCLAPSAEQQQQQLFSAPVGRSVLALLQPCAADDSPARRCQEPYVHRRAPIPQAGQHSWASYAVQVVPAIRGGFVAWRPGLQAHRRGFKGLVESASLHVADNCLTDVLDAIAGRCLLDVHQRGEFLHRNIR